MGSKVPEYIQRQRTSLPIFNKKDEFIHLVKQNQILIVLGETGSGKSTQLSQYLYEAGYGEVGRIGCTQPRRIGAKALACRVAQEFRGQLGEEVGYQIRFDNKTSAQTVICYMTDGVLLQEMGCHPNIDRYSVILLDEAHERSLYTDILLGLLKKVLKHRKDLKLIVTSATMDTQQFSKYFDYAPILDVTGRMFPVETIYVTDALTGAEMDYENACVRTVKKINLNEPSGDILIFLTGEKDIEKCCDTLSHDPTLHVVPYYSALTMEEQQLALEPSPEFLRKVVVATNIAETSLTIDGVVYVIDSSLANVNQFDPKNGLNTLVTQPISKAEAEQRKGRAGRTKPGKLYRLHSPHIYNRMERNPIPEVQRRSLDSVVLHLAACGVENIQNFNFMDPPSPEMIKCALSNLQDLGALDSFGHLTKVGRQISAYPVDPRLAKILFMSHSLNCCDEIIIIVSILSATETTGKLFRRPRKHAYEADLKKSRFLKAQGDHLTFLHVFESWRANKYSEDWCRENFINFLLLNEALDIQEQLRAIMKTHKVYKDHGVGMERALLEKNIQMTLTAGYFHQIVKRVSKYGYKTYSDANGKEQAFLHPSGALFKSLPKPDMVIYQEMKHTQKINLINCLVVEPIWIQTQAPSFYQKLVRIFPDLLFIPIQTNFLAGEKELDDFETLFQKLRAMK